VPSIFLISAEGEIETSIEGWSKPDMEELNRRLAEVTDTLPGRLFQAGEKIPDYKPG
jgi:hypothetical protein